MPPILIVNPFASRVTPARTAEVAAALGDPDVVFTERRGHATELAREADGEVEAVYVFSGDGGFNEVLNGVSASPVGLVPGGGASVLPRALGLPRDPVRAATRIRRRHTRRISLGRANGRRFGFSAGVGFDAELVRRVDARGRTLAHGRAGNTAFLSSALRVLAEERFRLEPALDVRGLGRASFALVANGSPYTFAGPVPLRVAPLADFEAGLDVVAPRRVGPTLLPRLLAYAVLGRGQERSPHVLHGHDLDALEIVCDRPLPMHVDGEDLGDVEVVRVQAERNAISVFV